MEVALWDHQRKAIENARGKPGYALFMEMGTGKTCTTINILRNEFNQQKRLLRTLIFTPGAVVPQWREEWKKFSKIDISRVVLLEGSGSKRLKTFKDHTKDSAQGCVFILNLESLLMTDLFSALEAWRPEAIVFDESSRLKSPSAKRSKLAYKLANPKTHKPLTYILSGTPILNSPMDIFQQIKIMLGHFPGRVRKIENFWEFRATYFRDRNVNMPTHVRFPNWQIANLVKDGFDAEGEMQQLLAAHSLRVTKEEALDLPEELSVVRKVDMLPEQKKAYKELQDDLVTYINGSACVASIALTKALRLMQVCSGHLPVEDENKQTKIIRFTNTPKDLLLKDLLEEITPFSKVLVWGAYIECYEKIRKICDDLDIQYAQVHGQIKAGDREDQIKRFTQDSRCRIFIGNGHSAGLGLNLVGIPHTQDRVTHSIFFSRDFSLEAHLQSRSRNHRGGQTEKVTHTELVCTGTIEELILQRLQNKEEIGKSLLSLAKDLADTSIAS